MLHLGNKFSSFEKFVSELEEYKSQKYSEFSIADCHTLDLIKKRRSCERILNAPPELKYYYIKFRCVHGGNCKSRKTTGQRNVGTMKMNCPAIIALTLSDDGQSLEISKFVEDHNHERSAELFSSLPKQRRLDPETQRQVMDHLALKGNKKLIQKKYSELTKKKITMKDLCNLAAKANRESNILNRKPNILNRKPNILNREPNILNQEPSILNEEPSILNEEPSILNEEPSILNEEPKILSSVEKYTKALVITNKLAELLSESSSFDEQMVFLQSVFDYWKKGRVKLGIAEIIATETLSSENASETLTSIPKPSQPTTLKGTVNLGEKTTEALTSMLILQPSQLTMKLCDFPIKVQGHPKGIRATAKKKIISAVQDPPTILQSHHNNSQTSCGISQSMDVQRHNSDAPTVLLVQLDNNLTMTTIE